MSLLWDAFLAARKALVGMVAGPPTPAPMIDYADGRTEALTALGDYLKALTWYRSGGEGKAPVPFKIRALYIEQPDDEQNMLLPSFGIIPGRGDELPAGFAPRELENTVDMFGPGTVVRSLATEYREVFQLELWTSEIPERRAVHAGLPLAFAPTDGAGCLRLTLPAYYGQTARFSLVSRNLAEDMAVQGRRKGLAEIELTVPTVHLARRVPLRPQVTVDVETGPIA